MIDKNKVYTLQEVSEILRISTTSLYKKIHSGQLDIKKIGKSYRIPGEQLEEMLKNGI